MDLASGLLEQAGQLAGMERGKPRQVSRRRAESATYYALFHLLVADAVQRVVPSSQPELRSRVSRAFQHADMKKICKQLQQSTLTPSLDGLMPCGISPQLRTVTNIFVEAQEARQRADYDIAARFGRSTTYFLVDQVESAFRAWKQIRMSEEANIFLAALAFASRWDR